MTEALLEALLLKLEDETLYIATNKAVQAAIGVGCVVAQWVVTLPHREPDSKPFPSAAKDSLTIQGSQLY